MRRMVGLPLSVALGCLLCRVLSGWQACAVWVAVPFDDIVLGTCVAGIEHEGDERVCAGHRRNGPDNIINSTTRVINIDESTMTAMAQHIRTLVDAHN